MWSKKVLKLPSLQFFIFLFVVPVGDAWGYREGVEAEGHSQVTDGQVNNEELGWF